MLLRELVERFEKQAPVSMMLRATMENVFSAERLDAMFERTAEFQENRKLLFSSMVDLMGLVALKIHPSVHAGYQARQQELGVTFKAICDKLQRMEVQVSRELVREIARPIAEIVDSTGGVWPEFLPGYYSKILDGNHLRRTERRLKELSSRNVAPLPGQCLVVLDPQRKLAIDVLPCEDGHAQERSLLPELLKTVEKKDLWIADRNFCTLDFLTGIQDCRACFVIRQHGGLSLELTGRLQKVGVGETGIVFEQSARLASGMMVRRITVQLHQATRDGDQEMHILSNLPRRVEALRIADLYRNRWGIETAFQEVAENLAGEIETLGYPRAALFSFCTALTAFNLLSAIRASFRAAHPKELMADDSKAQEATLERQPSKEKAISLYYLCDEVAHTTRGIEIALAESYWSKTYARLKPKKLAKELVRIAAGANIQRYLKHPRGPKKAKKPPKKKERNHASTAKILTLQRGYQVSTLC